MKGRQVIMNGRPYMLQMESSDAYHLIDYAPDGETAVLIVSKEDCVIGEQGDIRADHFEMDAQY